MRAEEREEFGFTEVETESFARDFELVVVDTVVAIKVEESELFTPSPSISQSFTHHPSHISAVPEDIRLLRSRLIADQTTTQELHPFLTPFRRRVLLREVHWLPLVVVTLSVLPVGYEAFRYPQHGQIRWLMDRG